MRIPKQVIIDLNKPKKNMVHICQGDNTRYIVLTLLCDGLPYDVTADIGAATLVKGVSYLKPNGVSGYYDWTTTDIAAVVAGSASNEWIVNLDDHATDVFGFTNIFVQFSLASGETLYSFPITLDIEQTSAGTNPDEPYYRSAVFLLKDAQAAKTPAMSFPVGVDDDGKLWAEGGWSAEAKEALIACFEQVAWKTPYGQTYLSTLETALFPTRVLSSITASYDQDRPIYDTDSLETVIATINLDLSVVANYSDGTTETLSSSDYTISGTVEAGASVPFTVTYEGKTTTISVLVLHQVVGWYYPFNESILSSGTEDFGFEGVVDYAPGVNGDAFYKHPTTPGDNTTDPLGIYALSLASNKIPNFTGDFTWSVWFKGGENLKGFPFTAYKFESGTTSTIISPTIVKSGWTSSVAQSISNSYKGVRIGFASSKFIIALFTTTGKAMYCNLSLPDTVDTSAWHHYAITRKSGTIRFFFDGEVICTATLSDEIYFPDQVCLGNLFGTEASTASQMTKTSLVGYYDDLYIAESCKWESSFDPTDIEY